MKTKLLILALSLGTVVSLNAQAPRKVIAEDFTGLWCGWCPLGRTTAEHLEAIHPTNVINMGQHSGDVLQCTYSSAIDATNNYGYPGFLIDRKPFFGSFFQGIGSCNGADLDTQVNQEIAATGPLNVGIATTYNTTTRALSVTLTAAFVASASGTMNMSVVLIEDSIATNGTQANYMTGNSSFPCWSGFANPIPTYYQRHTVRYSMTPTWGTAGIIPNSVVNGNTYSNTYNYTLPAAWNATHVFVVGFVNKYASGTHQGGIDSNNVYVMNANKVRIGSSVTTGVNEFNNDNLSATDVFPNPFNGTVNIPYNLRESDEVSVKVYDAMGKEVAVLFEGSETPGDHLVKWNGTDAGGNSLANGIYVCVIRSGNKSISKNIQLAR